MLRRTDSEFWQSVTGSLEPGEELEQAATREVFEETGIVATHIENLETTRRFPIKGVWRKRYSPEVTHNVEHWFGLSVPGSIPIQLQPEEHHEYQWLAHSDALNRVSSATNREAIELIVSKFQ